jgi:hypothetical protein
MPIYRATIQLTKLEGRDPATVRSDLEQAFARAGIGPCRIVAVEDEQIIATAPSRKIPFRSRSSRRRAVNRGVLLLLVAVAWALWFFWKLMGEE